MFVVYVVQLCENRGALLPRLLRMVSLAPSCNCAVAVCWVLCLLSDSVFFLSALYVWFVGRYRNVTCASNANAGFAAVCGKCVWLWVAVVNVVVAVVAG